MSQDCRGPGPSHWGPLTPPQSLRASWADTLLFFCILSIFILSGLELALTSICWMDTWVNNITRILFLKNKRDIVAWGKRWGTERKTLVERDLNSKVLKTCGHPKVTHHCAPTFFLSESRSVVSDSLRPHRLYSPWNSLGQNTGVGSLSLLQRIFPTQESNPGLL